MVHEHLLERASIFEQPWWLDAVAPGRWQEVVVEKDDEAVARWPFVVERRRGFTHVRRPPLCQHVGPTLVITAKKAAKRVSQEVRLLDALLDRLPRFDHLRLNLSPERQNWLPFYWRGFEETTRYTYRLVDLEDLEVAWSRFRDNIRRDIRKAGREVQVTRTADLDRFLELHDLTFARQGKRPPYARSLLERLDAACVDHEARTILLAEDASGRAHAAAYLVHDGRTMHYLMGGGDPDLRSSGATSLVMWEAIRHAAERGCVFDFEGSMLRHVERFFRAFGGEQVPFHQLEAMSRRARAVDRVLQALPPWR